MDSESTWALTHPKTKLSYADAIHYVEKWLAEHMLTDAQREREYQCHVYDYCDGDRGKLLDRPYIGVRVAEISFSNDRGGSSYMQVDMPWGIAFCGQVERCIIALIEGWNEGASANGPNYGETDEEFWRLGNLIEQANNLS